jgi:solute carrier family 50 protein (sugar transporter)
MSSGTFVTIIRVLSSMSAMYMCLSPTPTILKIRKTKSTGPVNVVPLAALWACNHLW